MVNTRSDAGDGRRGQHRAPVHLPRGGDFPHDELADAGRTLAGDRVHQH